MCLGTRYSGGVIMKRENFHPSIQHLYEKESFCVDDCIAKELSSLLASGLATMGLSCCGHGKERAHAYIYDEMVLKALEMGYEVAEFELMQGKKVKGIFLNTGTKISSY